MTNDKLWVVTFGTANVSDEGAVNTYCGCIGIFKDKPAAVKAMTDYKDEFVKELFADEDVSDVMVYGSDAEDYYEIDYESYDAPHEGYIRLEEVSIK